MAEGDDGVVQDEFISDNTSKNESEVEDKPTNILPETREDRAIQHPDGRTVMSVLTDEEALGVCGSRGMKHDAAVLWQTAQLMLIYPTTPPIPNGGLPLSPDYIFEAHRYAMPVVETRGIEAALGDAAMPMYPFWLDEDVVQVFDLLRPATVGDALAPPHLRIPGDIATLILALEAGQNGQSDAINIYDEIAGVTQPPVARVTPDGKFVPKTGTKARMGLVRFFRRFVRNPARTAAYYGRQSGTCCYCGRALSNPRSVEAGYGPDCAMRYRLPW